MQGEQVGGCGVGICYHSIPVGVIIWFLGGCGYVEFGGYGHAEFNE